MAIFLLGGLIGVCGIHLKEPSPYSMETTMRAAVYPTNTTRRVLPTNTQQPRKDKGRAYSFDRNGTRTIVQ